MRGIQSKRGFGLVELIVVVAILAILVGLLAVNWPLILDRVNIASCLSNMRQIGVATRLYADDHNQELPKRAIDQKGERPAKWPRLLADYLEDVRIYAAPGDKENFLRTGRDPVSDRRNYTSFIMNGYNDLGTMDDPEITVRVNSLEKPSRVILLGTPVSGSTHYYMDILEGRNGNHIDVLNLEAYGKGSPYLFADGSARFIGKSEYDHRMWLIDPDFVIPE